MFVLQFYWNTYVRCFVIKKHHLTYYKIIIIIINVNSIYIAPKSPGTRTQTRPAANYIISFPITHKLHYKYQFLFHLKNTNSRYKTPIQTINSISK